MKIKNILVLGASSYIGSNFLIHTKIDKEVRFHCLLRGSAPGTHFRGRENIECVLTDNVETFDFAGFFLERKINCVVNFIGSVKGTRESLRYVNYSLLKNILDKIIATNRIHCFIHMSTTAALLPIQIRGFYGEFKREFDSYLMASGINYLILEPAAVYGGLGDDNLNRYVNRIKDSHICPIIGDGDGLIQPIHIEEVISALDKVITDTDSFLNKELIVVRPQAISFLEFLKEQAAKYGASLKYIKVPLFLCKPMIKLQELVLRERSVILWEQVVRSLAGYTFQHSDIGGSNDN